MAKIQKRKMVRGFSIDQKLSDALDEFAKSRDRSVSWVIRQALLSYLPAYRKTEKPSKYYNDKKGILREKK